MSDGEAFKQFADIYSYELELFCWWRRRPLQSLRLVNEVCENLDSIWQASCGNNQFWVSASAIEVFTNARNWQYWHYCELCNSMYLQFPNLFTTYTVMLVITCQWVLEDWSGFIGAGLQFCHFLFVESLWKPLINKYACTLVICWKYLFFTMILWKQWYWNRIIVIYKKLEGENKPMVRMKYTTLFTFKKCETGWFFIIYFASLIYFNDINELYLGKSPLTLLRVERTKLA